MSGDSGSATAEAVFLSISWLYLVVLSPQIPVKTIGERGRQSTGPFSIVADKLTGENRENEGEDEFHAPAHRKLQQAVSACLRQWLGCWRERRQPGPKDGGQWAAEEEEGREREKTNP